jgi:ABC-type transport system involved in multi-copper enzyme maturation permease subunit
MNTLALQYVKSLVREKTVIVLMILLFGITIASSFIGWSSHHTIVAAYDQTILAFHASGRAIPPNPFAGQPNLAILRNMVIYVPLVGALLAIVIGQASVTADHVAGVTKLIFSRPISRRDYMVGKLLGISYILMGVVGVCLVTSVASLLFINSSLPTLWELARVTLFYLLSFSYLLLFAIIGFIAALITRSQSLALLGALAVWIVTSFVVPQFVSGTSPIASLNPASAPVDVSQSAFFRTTRLFKPVSISEEFKTAGLQLLDASPTGDTNSTFPQIWPLGVSLFGATYIGWKRLQRLTVHEESAND